MGSIGGREDRKNNVRGENVGDGKRGRENWRKGIGVELREVEGE